jgi:hypothetical protein
MRIAVGALVRERGVKGAARALAISSQTATTIAAGFDVQRTTVSHVQARLDAIAREAKAAGARTGT